MSEVINITCPGCKNNLELEGSSQDWAGQTIECPECKTAIVVPPAAPKKPLLRKKTMPPSPKCPECNAEMAPKAVVCMACGFDLRTGEKVSSDAASQNMQIGRKLQMASKVSSSLQLHPIPEPAEQEAQAAKQGSGIKTFWRWFFLIVIGLIIYGKFFKSDGKSQSGTDGAATTMMQTWKDQGGAAVKGVVDSRFPAAMDLSPIRIKDFSPPSYAGEDRLMMKATGQVVDTKEYSVAVSEFTGDANNPYEGDTITVSVAKDSGKVILVRFK